MFERHSHDLLFTCLRRAVHGNLYMAPPLCLCVCLCVCICRAFSSCSFCWPPPTTSTPTGTKNCWTRCCTYAMKTAPRLSTSSWKREYHRWCGSIGIARIRSGLSSRTHFLLVPYSPGRTQPFPPYWYFSPRVAGRHGWSLFVWSRLGQLVVCSILLASLAILLASLATHNRFFAHWKACSFALCKPLVQSGVETINVLWCCSVDVSAVIYM